MAVVFSHHRETHAAVVQLLRAQAKEDAKVHLAPFEVFEIHGAMDNTKRHAAVREVRLRPRTLGPHARGGGRALPSAAVHPPLHLTPSPYPHSSKDAERPPRAPRYSSSRCVSARLA